MNFHTSIVTGEATQKQHAPASTCVGYIIVCYSKHYICAVGEESIHHVKQLVICNLHRQLYNSKEILTQNENGWSSTGHLSTRAQRSISGSVLTTRILCPIAFAGRLLLNLARTIPLLPWARVTLPQMTLVLLGLPPGVLVVLRSAIRHQA